MDSTKRLLLALALSFVATAVFMWLSPKPEPVEAPEAEVAEAIRPEEAPAPTPAPTPGAPGVAPAPTAPAAEVKEIVEEEDDVRYLVTTRGAGLLGAELQGEKMREQRQLTLAQGYKLLAGGEVPDAPQIDMATPAPNLPPSLAVGVTGAAPLDPNAVWNLVERDRNRMVFTLQQGPWQARKVLEWPQSDEAWTPASRGFEVAMTVSLTNVSQQPQQGELGVYYHRAVDPATEEKASFFGGVGNESKATCFVQEDLHHLVPAQDAPEPEELRGPVRYFGVDQQYFLGAIFTPEAARPGRCELIATPTVRGAVGYFPIAASPGETITQEFGTYIGPKDVDLLRMEPTPAISQALGVAPTVGSAELARTVDFGIWEFICVVLLWILKFFHGVFGNWGLAIVFLTVVVKLALLPLTIKSMIAAENMKKLQPQVEEIRKKHGQDPQKMNQEMMKLYSEAKVNPLGGCFPLLLQMPVWIALFTTLRASYEIYREPFFGPVWTDLTYKDPTYILPVLLGVTMIATQKLQPSMMDKAQQRIMTWFMPIFFTALMLAYPAGLTLYIFTNNVLSIVQQYGLRKWMERQPVAAPAKK